MVKLVGTIVLAVIGFAFPPAWIAAALWATFAG